MKKYCPIVLAILSVHSAALWAETPDAEPPINTIEAEPLRTRNATVASDSKTRLAERTESEYEESWSALWE